jgi:hypothetical protein
MAILLRLGDLLDMSHDRACPLLLNAACPLPAESLAHWTKYQRITHRLTAPEAIEIRAECENQEEHRYLQDWCQWLVDEVREAGVLAARCLRHAEWRPPHVSLGGPAATITVEPAPTASYLPSSWTFDLDNDAVFQRLIRDVYQEPDVFVRELIQNALDATRCQMYHDLLAEGIEPPEYPTQVDPARRHRYPVRISLATTRELNELSGEQEVRQVLSVEDVGLGMDKDIIERYFLQVGRSFYTTDEFRRRFRFVPTSRFGLGFLSVFAVSDRVTVETYKPSSAHGDGPLRLTLTGPRNYLLTERGVRPAPGTRIDVALREPMDAGKLTELVTYWCRRVEFPVAVDDIGHRTEIRAERSEDFTYEMPDVTQEGASFVLRAFPVDRPGIEGELYVLAHVGPEGERWDLGRWARYGYPSKSPRAIAPEVPRDLTCVHGVSIGAWMGDHPAWAARVDCRREAGGLSIARYAGPDSGWVTTENGWGIGARLGELLAEHLASSPFARGDEAWSYKQRLVGLFCLPAFWTSAPGAIHVSGPDEARVLSLADVMGEPAVTSAVREPGLAALRGPRSAGPGPPAWDGELPCFAPEGIEGLSDEHRRAVFQGRRVRNARALESGHLALDWAVCAEPGPDLLLPAAEPAQLAALPQADEVGVVIHKTIEDVYQCVILNDRNPFVRWLIRAQGACVRGSHGLGKDQGRRLGALVLDAVRYTHLRQKLLRYLDEWRRLPGLPSELRPPRLEERDGVLGVIERARKAPSPER